MIKLKPIFIVIVVLAISTMVGCSTQDVVDNEDYARKYYEIFNSLETTLSEQLISETADLLDIQTAGINYSHIDFVHFYDEMLLQIDDVLYQLSILGPQLQDETLMKYQSKLEYDLFHLLDTLKLYREHRTFSTNMTNIYTWFDELYNIVKDISPTLINININKVQIESQLASLGYPGTEKYEQLTYENFESFAYIYSVLASQVSSYQDYSGLQVTPRNPVAIETTDGHWHSTAELDYSVMIPVTKSLTSYMDQMNSMSDTLDIDISKTEFVNEYFINYLETYEKYALIRSDYSYTFFKSGEFKDYQIQQGLFNPQNGGSGFPLHIFDPSKDEEHHLTEMTEYFNEIQQILINNDHKRFLIRHE